MYNVITLKHGTLYGADYVNKMYNMVKRNLTLPFTFYCVTDDFSELDKDIKIVLLPGDYKFKGWWWKPYIFKTGLFEGNEVNFYIDLDMVIVDNIDCYMTFDEGKFVGLRDFGHDRLTRLASGIMRWENNTMNMIWERLTRDPAIAGRFPGDQEYIWQYQKDQLSYFPPEWTPSYKYHIKKNKTYDQKKIIAFHGRPNPHEVTDQIIVDNWK